MIADSGVNAFSIQMYICFPQQTKIFVVLKPRIVISEVDGDVAGGLINVFHFASALCAAINAIDLFRYIFLHFAACKMPRRTAILTMCFLSFFFALG